MRKVRTLTISGLLAIAVGAPSCGGAQASAEPEQPKVPSQSFESGPPATPDPAHNLIKRSDFEDGVMMPWQTSFTNPAKGSAEVKEGALCITIDGGGTNPWDAQLRTREIVIQEKHNYAIKFKIWASRDTKSTLKVGMSNPPYTDYFNRKVQITTTPQVVEHKFTMWEKEDPTAEFAFHLGGSNLQGDGPIDVCIDDVILADPTFTPSTEAEAAPLAGIRVNQVGYFPGLSKVAVLVSDAKEPQEWQLVDANGAEVAKGKTKPTGEDAASGDSLHSIDFSSFKTEGKDFMLKSGAKASPKFDIRKDLYAQMRYDALKYFYHNRSGIEIKMPFSVEAQWARPAGHLPDKAPCAPDTGCKYTLDVTGGWYDAGDHGKYVVNGGISVWTLMNWFERATHLAGDTSVFADGTASIPESANKVPDILDEARWQMEFMLKMQVPSGKPLAGMAHHKIHDKEWTALGLAPHEDPQKRFLRPPSTAATLNLAATAAQASRIWKSIDPKFSERALIAAEAAWKAAKANPAIYAVKEDTIGGGPYNDDDVSDEFYWAAAELFITTGKDDYKTELTKSPLDKKPPPDDKVEGGSSAIYWGRVETLGKISLAIVPNKLGKWGVAGYKKQITALADGYLAMAKKEGYGLPMRPNADGKYAWGSNSLVLNNMLVLALAYDFDKKHGKYLEATAEGMNYLLGRNAMDQCYVTGYGSRPLRNPHHRFWAYQANKKFPKPPPGAISGGPNSGLEDPLVQAAGLKGCAPQKCFIDHIDAWSANEITINWNAPFAWLAAWLNENAK